MQVERKCGKKVYLRPGTSEKNDIINYTKKTEPMSNEFEITTSTKILKNHHIENVGGRKTKDKSGLKPTLIAWYERLTNFFN